MNHRLMQRPSPPPQMAGEVDAAFPERPLEALHALGGLHDRLVAVHCVQLSDADIRALAQTGASVVHCPR